MLYPDHCVVWSHHPIHSESIPNTPCPETVKNNQWTTVNNHEQLWTTIEKPWRNMKNHEQPWKQLKKKTLKNNEKHEKQWTTTMNIQAAVIERQLPEDCDVLQQLNVLLLESSQAWMNVNHGFLIRGGTPTSRSFFSDFIWYFHGTPIKQVILIPGLT